MARPKGTDYRFGVDALGALTRSRRTTDEHVICGACAHHARTVLNVAELVCRRPGETDIVRALERQSGRKHEGPIVIDQDDFALVQRELDELTRIESYDATSHREQLKGAIARAPVTGHQTSVVAFLRAADDRVAARRHLNGHVRTQTVNRRGEGRLASGQQIERTVSNVRCHCLVRRRVCRPEAFIRQVKIEAPTIELDRRDYLELDADRLPINQSIGRRVKLHGNCGHERLDVEVVFVGRGASRSHLGAVDQTVPIGVRCKRIGTRLHLGAVAEPVVVGIRVQWVGA